jgi:hypothetical protein
MNTNGASACTTFINTTAQALHRTTAQALDRTAAQAPALRLYDPKYSAAACGVVLLFRTTATPQENHGASIGITFMD